jgi:hypothetical protein
MSHALASPITVDNFKNKEIIRYPVPLIRGTLADSSEKEITIKNLETGKEIAGVAHKGKFKLLTELKPGENRLVIKSGGKKFPLIIEYKPQTTPYVLRIHYITDNTGETKYISPIPDDPQNYEEKLGTLAKLAQTFCADTMDRQGYGKKTFNLEFDEKDDVVVHLHTSPKPRSYFHENSSFTWYGHVSGLVNQEFPAGKGLPGRNLGIANVTEFDKKKKGVVGGCALGAPGLALFGSGSMYCMPNSIEDTFRAFSDDTPIDPKKEFDDSAGRSARWALASTAIGACVHEFGHAFGLPHTKDNLGIMKRGFDRFNRVFMFVEPKSRHNKKPIEIDDTQIARWCPAYAGRLNKSRFLSMDDIQYANDIAPVISRDEKDPDTIIIESTNGIAWVGFYDYNGGDLYIGTDAKEEFKKPYPRRKTYSIKEVVNTYGHKQFSIGASDCLGNDALAYPKHLGIFSNKKVSLTTGKKVQVTHDEGDYKAKYAVDGYVDKESMWSAPGKENGQGLAVDLGTPTEIDRIVVYPYWDGRRYYQYTVEISKNGKQWTMIADKSDNTEKATENGHTHTFNAQKVKYIKVTMLKNSDNPWLHLVELQAFGPE